MPWFRSRLGVLAFLAVPACSVQNIEGTEDGTGAIVGGVPTSLPEDVAIVAVTSPNDPAWICSGSVIAPRVVLTAAHCVEGGNTDKTGWYFEVFIGADRDQKTRSDTSIKVKEFHFPELYRSAVLGEPSQTPLPDDGADGDIAVLILETPAGVRPLAWNRGPLDTLEGNEARISGYGRTVPKGEPGSRNGLRKTASVKMNLVQPATVSIAAGDNPCHGDSGGPLLIKHGEEEVVVGVGHMTFSETCRDGADYERTDRYAAWVQSYVDQNR